MFRVSQTDRSTWPTRTTPRQRRPKPLQPGADTCPRPSSSRRRRASPSRSANGGFLKIPLTTRQDLRALPLSPNLASLVTGPLVALRDLLTKFVEGRRRCRPSGAGFLALLRHRAALLIAPLGRLATGRMQSAAPRRWTLPLTLYSAASGYNTGGRQSGRTGVIIRYGVRTAPAWLHG